jgi:hypothetical protein
MLIGVVKDGYECYNCDYASNQVSLEAVGTN